MFMKIERIFFIVYIVLVTVAGLFVIEIVSRQINLVRH